MTTPAELQQLHPRQRVDTLRKALRTGQLDHELAQRDLAQWIDMFRQSRDPGLLVLVLEVLQQLEGDEILTLAHEAMQQRADGVRLEAARLLLDRRPEHTMDLVQEHRNDYSLEVQLLLAQRLYPHDAQASIDLIFEILAEEAGGERETHALERTTEFLVEEAPSPQAARRLVELREDFDDPEGFVDWALDQLPAP